MLQSYFLVSSPSIPDEEEGRRLSSMSIFSPNSSLIKSIVLSENCYYLPCSKTIDTLPRYLGLVNLSNSRELKNLTQNAACVKMFHTLRHPFPKLFLLFPTKTFRMTLMGLKIQR